MYFILVLAFQEYPGGQLFFQVYKKASYHFEAVISCVVVVPSEGESDTAQQTVADDLWQVARA